MSSARAAFLVSVLVFCGLLALLLVDRPRDGTGDDQKPLLVYCGGALRKPMEELAMEYGKQYGVRIQVQYGASEPLLTSARITGKGDLYIPADDSYVQKARGQGLVRESLPIASMQPVLAVRKGNPLGIHSLQDLLRSHARLAQADPDAAAIGYLTRSALQKRGQWEAMKNRTAVFLPMITDVANAVVVGSADAGIVFDATVKQYPMLEMVPLPELSGATAHVSIGILGSASRPAAALRFARFLTARDRGLLTFAKFGYHVVDGDKWAETPELHLLCGSILRPAIEKTLGEFEKREGVRVTRVYNGCGILVAQMKAGEHPDAYFACDVSFMRQVHDLFLDEQDLSTDQIVMLVPKGNPNHIRTLRDLARPGLRVGIGNEKQCALGALSKRVFVVGGVYADLMKNVKVQAPTGDLLVNELRTGDLDAVVAYRSNMVNANGELEAVNIDIPCSIAVQPIATGRQSDYKYLTGRLTEALKSAGSEQQFTGSGFQWIYGKPGAVPPASLLPNPGEAGSATLAKA